MKKNLLIRFVIFLSLAAGSADYVLYAQNNIPLNEAIQAGAAEIEYKLEQGTKVIVLGFQSPSQRLSNYVLEEMQTVLVRNGKLIVVERANLELVEREMDFQMSGEVSDSSAQAIGKKLGAQSIVSGSIEDMGTQYRVRFRTIEVETAAIQVLSPFDVRKDNFTANLTGSAAGSNFAGNYSATPYPNGLNFSVGRKIGSGFLNLIYGIGSFTMRDVWGGIIVGGMELTGMVLLFTGMFNSVNVSYPNEYDYPLGMDDPGYKAAYKKSENEDTPYIVIGVIGLGLYLAGEITGFVRPFTYDIRLAKKNGTYYAFGKNPMGSITVAPAYPKSAAGMSVLYSVSY